MAKISHQEIELRVGRDRTIDMKIIFPLVAALTATTALARADEPEKPDKQKARHEAVQERREAIQGQRAQPNAVRREETIRRETIRGEPAPRYARGYRVFRNGTWYTYDYQPGVGWGFVGPGGIFVIAIP
jgi:hypothetical protein